MGTCLIGEWHTALSLRGWDTGTLWPSAVSAEIPNSEEKRNTRFSCSWNAHASCWHGLLAWPGFQVWALNDWYFPPNCLIRFPRFLQESVCLGDGRHIREGGYRVVTDFPKSSILLYWNASQMKEGGSRDLVQVCANHKSCSASFHLQFIALTFLLCWLLLGSYCKFGQLQLLFHLSLLSSVGSVTSKVAHSAEAGSVS